MAECIFCAIVAGNAPCAMVYEDELCMAFMDRFPWRPGHTLIISRAHAQHLNELPEPTRDRIFQVASRVRGALPATGIGCDAANIFLNDGKAANQHVPHVHVHVLPRVRGDSLRMAGTLLTRVGNYFGGGPALDRLQDHAARIRSAMAGGSRDHV